MFLVLLAIAGLALYVLALLRAAPIEYSEDRYAPARAVYAPGETLAYTPTLTVRHAGHVLVVRSFWNVTKNTSALVCSGSAAPIYRIERNFPASVVGNVRGGQQVQVTVPPLPPGDYLLITSASGPGGGQAITEVPFTIVQQCE